MGVELRMGRRVLREEDSVTDIPPEGMPREHDDQPVPLTWEPVYAVTSSANSWSAWHI